MPVTIDKQFGRRRITAALAARKESEMKTIKATICAPCKAYIGTAQTGDPLKLKKGDKVELPHDQAIQFFNEGWIKLSAPNKAALGLNSKARGAAPENKTK